MSSSLDARLDLLRDFLRRLQPGLIAVSGGVDSRFLAHAAWSWGLDFQAAYAVGPHQTAAEQQRTLGWLKPQPGPVHVVRFSPLDLPAVRTNPRRRCYHCKHALFSRLKTLAQEQDCSAVLDGTQSDDLTKSRPGQQALQELGIHSPLARTGWAKSDIRLAAILMDLADPLQPAKPCLLTRFAYDRPVTREQLAAVAAAEDRLEQLGLQRFRLRISGDAALLLQIRSDEQEQWEVVQERAKLLFPALGLPLVHVQFTNAVSGFFDKE